MRPQPLAIGSLVVGVACAGLSLGGYFGDRYSWCIRQNPCISNESWRKPDPEIKAQLMPGIGITRTIAGVVGAIAMGGAFLAGGAAAIAEEKRLVLEAAAKEETKQLAITQAAVLLEEEKQKLAIASELRIDAFGNEQLNAHAKLFLLENPEVIERFTAPPAPSAPPALPAPLSPKPEQQPELAAAQKFQIDTDTVHLDSSSFHLHGEYEIQDVQVTLAPGKINSVESDMAAINHLETPVPITITYGYSRDHRPDLKQFILDIICSGDGDIPLFLRVGSGNEADSAVFGRILKEFKQQLNLDNLMVADSALYTATNL